MVQSHKTAGSQKTFIARLIDDNEKISAEDKKFFHSKPDVANMTKELSKANKGVNLAGFCSLL